MPQVRRPATGRGLVRGRMLAAVAGPFIRDPTRAPADRRLRRSWWFLAGSFFVLGLVTTLRLAVGQGQRIDWILAALVLVAGFAAVIHREAVGALEAGRRREAESFARIMQGLSRSVSPDAIVDAIVEELGVGTGADHIVVVRLRPDAGILESTLVSRRPGVPSSTTILPISELEDPQAEPSRLPYVRRPAVAIPMGLDVPSPVLAAAASWTGGPLPAVEVWPHPAVVSQRSVGVMAEPDARLSSAQPSSSPSSSARSSPAPPIAARRTSDRAARRERRRGWATLAAVASLRASVSGASHDGEVGLPHNLSGPDTRIAERLAGRVRSDYGLKHTIAAPLVTGSGVVGAIVLSRRTDDIWPVAAQRILAGAAIEASAALDRAYSHRAAETRAATDALTGLPNRRYFDEFCGLLARRRRADDALGVLMIDIDRFKRLNDTHGHGIGDQVLRAVAAAIAGAVREDDVPARFGGEEFAVLLRNPEMGIAMAIGERVRFAVAGLDLHAIGVGEVSVSIGVALSEAADQPIDTVIEQADRALYAAKRAGRNRVVAAQPALEVAP
jgi:diguanylate cyclase (GGDEF)-like protein